MYNLYRNFFEDSEPNEWYYSNCCDGAFNITCADKKLILNCSECGEETARLAIQEPLWAPKFEHEAIFRYADGKFHVLQLPCKIRSPEESDKWWNESERQKYRMVFIPREREGVEKLTTFMDYLR